MTFRFLCTLCCFAGTMIDFVVYFQCSLSFMEKMSQCKKAMVLSCVFEHLIQCSFDMTFFFSFLSKNVLTYRKLF